ncbi:DUF4349 domain-containing protein [Parafrankia elaeagni]|uniref:DUF4349 domain-containing protein n=1 Tax=Parafrankia elaeagni TaxID=222534 RepID=UPI000374F34A|nr:DUF4349 domain-containing protein [Parafrankia elaeagni]
MATSTTTPGATRDTGEPTSPGRTTPDHPDAAPPRAGAEAARDRPAGDEDRAGGDEDRAGGSIETGGAGEADPVSPPAVRRRRRIIVGALILTGVLLGGVALGAVADELDDGSIGTSSFGAAESAPIEVQADSAGPSGTGPSQGRGLRETDSDLSSGVGAAAPSPGVARDAPARSSTVPGQPGGTGGEPARPAGAEPRIVRNGTTTLLVPVGQVDRTVQGLSATVTGLDGYVESSEVSGTSSTTDDDYQYATVALRVPTASFERLRSGLGELGEISSATTSSRDVTGEYVDLEARKRALEASRAAYLGLLAKATTVGETLSVQQAIDGVQIQIEQIEGQRMVLADASDLATLSVRITEADAGSSPAPDDDESSGLGDAASRSWDRFVRGIEVIIALIGPLVLVGLLAGVAYAAVRLTRRLRRPAAPAVDPGETGSGAPSAPSGGPEPTVRPSDPAA